MYVGFRTLLLDEDGVLDGGHAADAGAVLAFLIPGANTLDHDHVIGFEFLRSKERFQIKLGDHPLTVVIKEPFRLEHFGAGCDYDHADTEILLDTIG